MKNSRLVSILLVLLMAASLLSACAANNVTPAATDAPVVTDAPAATDAPTATDAPAVSSEPVAEGFTLTDMLGREVSFDAPVESIVALTASDCEIIYALGAGQLVVGRGEYCDYPAEVADIPAMQSGSETNIEQIIALAPDAVVMSAMAQTEEQVASLENAGIRVVMCDADNIAEVYTSIELLGALCGKTAEAAALVDSMKTAFNEISSNATAAEGKTVYFEVSPLEWGLWTAGKNTFMDEIAGMMNLTNIFADVDGWAEVSEEQVIERNPDYIVTITMYYGEGPTPVEEILSRAGWQDISAVKNANVWNAVSDELSRPAPRLVDGAKALYDFVYGG